MPVVENKILTFNHFGKPVNILLIYPNSYKTGISNLGHQTVYKLFNQSENINCERIFLEKDFKYKNLKSLETERYPGDFDMIAFSISYEPDILRIFEFLKKCNIQLSPENRTEPVILCGGIFSVINPELLKSFSDIVIQGDIENIIGKLNSDFLKIKQLNKTDFIEYINQQDYINKINNSDNIESYSVVLSVESEFKDTFLIELMRGCPNKCNFCITGNRKTKLKFFDTQKVFRIIKRYKDNIKKIGLIGSSVLCHPEFKEMLEFALQNNIKVTVSSLDINYIKLDLIKNIVDLGQKTVTLAPEVGNLKMAGIINKKIDFQKSIEIIKELSNIKVKKIKLYFLYGLPEETQEDLNDIIEFIKKIKQNVSLKNKSCILKISLNPLVPKNNTPFEKMKMETKKILNKKKKFLFKNIKKMGIFCSGLNLREAVLQYNISKAAHYAELV